LSFSREESAGGDRILEERREGGQGMNRRGLRKKRGRRGEGKEEEEKNKE
jgi:hypothetical protein